MPRGPPCSPLTVDSLLALLYLIRVVQPDIASPRWSPASFLAAPVARQDGVWKPENVKTHARADQRLLVAAGCVWSSCSRDRMAAVIDTRGPTLVSCRRVRA